VDRRSGSRSDAWRILWRYRWCLRPDKIVDAVKTAYTAYENAPGLGVAGKGELFQAYRTAEAAAQNSVAGTFKSAAKGMLMGALDVAVDSVLQETIGKQIGRPDLFKPTPVELLGVSMAAALPLEKRLSIALTSAAWLEGRVENFFHR
jgi:hypothetical protein